MIIWEREYLEKWNIFMPELILWNWKVINMDIKYIKF